MNQWWYRSHVIAGNNFFNVILKDCMLNTWCTICNLYGCLPMSRRHKKTNLNYGKKKLIYFVCVLAWQERSNSCTTHEGLLAPIRISVNVMHILGYFVLQCHPHFIEKWMYFSAWNSFSFVVHCYELWSNVSFASKTVNIWFLSSKSSVR